VTSGFFDDLPLGDDWADLVVACSALTPATGHGGEVGLEEMERVCRPEGLVVIVWPNNLDWLAAHGYGYVSFAGEMFVEFASREDAAELIEIFYPGAPAEMRGGAQRRVSYEDLGINPPRDVAFKAKAP
jgi:SAM-dependent methyltransferase